MLKSKRNEVLRGLTVKFGIFTMLKRLIGGEQKAQLNKRTNSYLKRYADNRKQLLNLYEVNL